EKISDIKINVVSRLDEEVDDETARTEMLVNLSRKAIAAAEEVIQANNVIDSVWTPAPMPMTPFAIPALLNNTVKSVEIINSFIAALSESDYSIRDLAAISFAARKSKTMITTPSGQLFMTTEDVSNTVNMLLPEDLQIKIFEIVKNYWISKQFEYRIEMNDRVRRYERQINKTISDFEAMIKNQHFNIYYIAMVLKAKLAAKTIITASSDMNLMANYMRLYYPKVKDEDIENIMSACFKIPVEYESSLYEKNKVIKNVFDNILNTQTERLIDINFMLMKLRPIISSEKIRNTKELRKLLFKMFDDLKNSLENNFTKKKLVQLHNCMDINNEPLTKPERDVCEIYSKFDRLISSTPIEFVNNLITDVLDRVKDDKISFRTSVLTILKNAIESGQNSNVLEQEQFMTRPLADELFNTHNTNSPINVILRKCEKVYGIKRDEIIGKTSDDSLIDEVVTDDDNISHCSSDSDDEKSNEPESVNVDDTENLVKPPNETERVQVDSISHCSSDSDSDDEKSNETENVHVDDTENLVKKPNEAYNIDCVDTEDYDKKYDEIYKANQDDTEYYMKKFDNDERIKSINSAYF
ncbi:MAG: hypothetical protein KDH96_07750, partial [Candidatus Riesia sp.]|nr:hypothetical protein [Candidatus Riesia sp.]